MLPQENFDYCVNAYEGRNSSVPCQDLYKLLVLRFCGFANTELSMKANDKEIPFSLIFCGTTLKRTLIKPIQGSVFLAGGINIQRCV